MGITGGGIEEGESDAEAMHRELLEETAAEARSSRGTTNSIHLAGWR